ncbi:MAG TPA: metallopeptidase family protein [Anaeromyxobacteraceae bacterium]|nr:metallopeptidase family protein [Anaeromyxobacteraceae bacterium]
MRFDKRPTGRYLRSMAAEEPRSEADRLADEAADAFEAGDVERALTRAEEALRLEPRSLAAAHYRAAALADLGRLEDAAEAYRRALEAAPDDLDLVVGAADFFVNRAQGREPDRELLERGLALARRGLQRARKVRAPEVAAELQLVEGVALSQLGDARAALARFEAVLRELPDDVDAMLERGYALFELLKLDEARAQLEAVLRRAPDEAWAWHALGLVAERQGDRREAERRFARARKLSPEDFPRPVELPPQAFDAVVEEALAALPEPIRRYLANVAIAVEDIPADEDLEGSDPPLSPSILGLFRGAPLPHKASMDPWSHFPSSIVLYQRNLERFARERKELIEQIGITLIHEVGHFLGLDEDQLWERGLE